METWCWLVLVLETADLRKLKSVELEALEVALRKLFSIPIGGLQEEAFKEDR
jgi:hypothetical protein